MLKTLTNSYGIFIENIKLSLIAILLDILNFFVFGGIYGVAFFKAIPHVEALSMITGLEMKQALDAKTEQDMSKVLAALSSFYTEYYALLRIAIYTALVFLAVWII